MLAPIIRHSSSKLIDAEQGAVATWFSKLSAIIITRSPPLPVPHCIILPCLMTMLLCLAPALAQDAPLKPNAPVTAKLAGEQQRTHTIYLLANQYLRATLKNSGIELSIRLLAPAGSEIVAANSNSGNLGETVLTAITSKPGAYQFIVKANEKDDVARAYTLTVTAARPTDAQDGERVAADRLMLEGEALRSEPGGEKRKEAFAKFNAALAMRTKLNSQGKADRLAEAQTIASLGRTHHDANERAQAIEFYQRSIEMRRANDDEAGLAMTYTNLAGALNGAGDLPKAQAAYNEALKLRRAAQDKRGEANVLSNLGTTYVNRGDCKNALTSYGPAQQFANEIGDRRTEADALVGLGLCKGRSGDRAGAIKLYEQALPLYQSLGNRGGAASATQSIGVAYAFLGQRDKALEYLNQALPLAQAAKNRASEANIRNTIATLRGEQGETAEAIRELNELIPLYQELKNTRNLATTLNNLADLHNSIGERQKALDYYQQALPLVRQVGGSTGEIPYLNGLAGIYSALGEKQQALDLYQQAFTLVQQLKNPAAEASTLNNLALLYASLGDRARALELTEQALQLTRQIKNPVEEANLLNNLGNLYFNQGETERALESFKQALALAGQQPLIQINALNDQALVYNELEQRDKANELLNRALVLSRQGNYRSAEATTLHNLAWLARAGGDNAAARTQMKEALLLKQQIGDRSGEASTLFGLAQIELSLNNLDAARETIEAALTIVESTRTKVASQDLRTSYFASVRKFYDFYLDVLMQLDRRQGGDEYAAQALQASERSRARSLLEMLAEARADIRRGADAKLVTRERELQDLLNGKADALLQAKLRKDGEAQAATLSKELDTLTNELQTLRSDIRRQSPRYAAITQPQPLTVRELQRQVLDDDTLLLEYALGEERSYLWAVTPNSLRSYTLPKRAVIEAAAKEVYQSLISRKQSQRKLKTVKAEGLPAKSLSPVVTEAQLARATAKLSRMILQPVASQLGHKRLLVVAEGFLQYVPFGALPEPLVVSRQSSVVSRLGSTRNGQRAIHNRQPLIVNHEIVTLPSASTLAVLRDEVKDRPLAPRSIAVFADPVFDARDERLLGQNKGQERRDKGQERQEKGQATLLASSGQRTTDNGQKTNPQSEDVARKLIVTKLAGADEAFRVARLKFTRNEAEQIINTANNSDSSLVLDFAANRTALFAPELSQYRIVHIATHGLLDAERPELSALIFSLVDQEGKTQNGFLRAHEVFNLNLPAELVVLSACETGLGKQVKGEGLIGLTRGFMYAGAPRVLVSLWAVSDRATSELMTRFYQKMLTDKQRPAQALRNAQIEMWRDGRWRAPYYWAAFTLQGEWK